MIDASEGYIKDGNKNRLREQDIEKIVQVFINQTDLEGYSRFVSYKEIMEEHDDNLNIPRYISKIDTTLSQNIHAHLNGGIPKADIDSMDKLWLISRELKAKLFQTKGGGEDTYELVAGIEDIEGIIFDDPEVQSKIKEESEERFELWKNSVEDQLKSIAEDTDPKALIRALGLSLLNAYEDAKFLDNYDVYDFLLNYWNEQLQDDVYVIKASGYEAGRDIEREYGKKKVKDEQGIEIEVDDPKKFKAFEGLLIPRSIIEREYFADDLEEIEEIQSQINQYEDQMQELFEEQTGEEGLLVEVLNDKGDKITKTNLANRIKELDSKKVSQDVDALYRMLEVFDTNQQEPMKKIFAQSPSLSAYELRNKNGKFGKGKIKTSLKEAQEQAQLPEIYQEEYDILLDYQALLDQQAEAEKSLKEKNAQLDEIVIEKYGQLFLDEVKDLLFEKKWMARLNQDIKDALDQEIIRIASKLLDISKRYENTLTELEDEVQSSRREVQAALERMGYTW